MKAISSWAALINREYLEHRLSFLYFPVGILVLLQQYVAPFTRMVVK